MSVVHYKLQHVTSTLIVQLSAATLYVYVDLALSRIRTIPTCVMVSALSVVSKFLHIQLQAFRFIVGPGHCPMISKYGPSHSKDVGQVDPSFLDEKNHTLIKIFILQRVYELHKTESLNSKTCLKQHSKKDKTNILITNVA